MASDSGPDNALHPKQSLRRFDVFAAYQRLSGANGHGCASRVGYGLWMAKIVPSVSSRRTSATTSHQLAERSKDRANEDRPGSTSRDKER
jgi:hypothetical protein